MGYSDAVKRFSEDIGKYADDEINTAELALRLTGEGGGLLSDWVATGLDYMVPDNPVTGLLNDWLAQETGSLVNAGKTVAPQGVVDYLSDPRVSRNLESAFNTGMFAAPMQLASPKQWHAFANNMPNELPLFYKGMAPYEIARATMEGVKNRGRELLDPRSQALLREQNLPAMTQNIIRQANEDAVKLKAARDALPKSDPQWNELDKQYKQRAKVGMGQIGQNKLLNEQYGIKSAMIDEAAKDFTYSVRDFTPESLRAIVPELSPEASDAIFRTIAQTQGERKYFGLAGQKVPLKDGIMVHRKTVANAAGDLGGDVRKKDLSNKKVQPIFSNRPLKEGFKGYKDFITSATPSKGFSKDLKKLLDKPEIKKSLGQMARDPEFKTARTREQFDALFDKHNVGLSKDKRNTLMNLAFSGKGVQPFGSNAALIKALEDKGLTVYNKAKIKEGEPAILVDSFRSGAMDLGGVGSITAVFPDGRKYNIIHDKNDLAGRTPLGAKNGISVAVQAENLVTGQKPHVKPESYQSGMFTDHTGTNFVMPATNQQKAILKGIMNYEPNVGLIDRARAARNAGLLSSYLMGYTPIGSQSEHK